MILEFILTIVIAFVIVVAGSYVGAKMALNVVFGRDFDPSELTRADPPDATRDETDH